MPKSNSSAAKATGVKLQLLDKQKKMGKRQKEKEKIGRW